MVCVFPLIQLPTSAPSPSGHYSKLLCFLSPFTFLSRSTGESVACAVNRSSPYFLMIILLNLFSLLLEVVMKLEKVHLHMINLTHICVAISWGFPALLMVIAYSIEGDDAGSENELLNTARHGFSCSMRFKNSMEEWLLLWAHFSWSELFNHMFNLYFLS
jgi:hypothetical protein